MVNWPEKKRPKALAASTTARKPATLAVLESTSKACARLMVRGTQSRPTTVAPRFSSFCTSASFCAGWIIEMSVGGGASSSEPPFLRRATSASVGGRMCSTTSPPQHSGRVPMVAPASLYSSSE